jgi:hypothetical protein
VTELGRRGSTCGEAAPTNSVLWPREGSLGRSVDRSVGPTARFAEQAALCAVRLEEWGCLAAPHWLGSSLFACAAREVQSVKPIDAQASEACDYGDSPLAKDSRPAQGRTAPLREWSSAAGPPLGWILLEPPLQQQQHQQHQRQLSLRLLVLRPPAAATAAPESAAHLANQAPACARPGSGPAGCGVTGRPLPGRRVGCSPASSRASPPRRTARSAAVRGAYSPHLPSSSSSSSSS